MGEQYILDEQGEPVACYDLMAWGRWMEREDNGRRVALDTIGDVKVSTVFLGLDHSFGRGVPVLWETMIFGGTHDGHEERYTSKAAALEGHRRAVELVTAPPDKASVPEPSHVR